MNKNIINLAILGGVGYAVYYFLGKKKILTETTTTDASVPAPTTTPKTTTNQNSTYAKRVEVLQGLLKVAIDGKVGKQTNGALENLYSSPPTSYNPETSFKNNYPNLRKNGKGVISPSNVEFYINALQTKTTPYNLFYKDKDLFVDDMRNMLPKEPVKLPWQ
jgi:hypothetical protein